MSRRLVVCLVRVSTEAQEWERQRRRKLKILKQHDLEELQEFALKISGTKVEKTQEYRDAMILLRRRDVVGMVVPSIDRWFRYKLISEIGRYVEPFEEMIDGDTNKLMYCNLGALNLRVREDQDKIIDAVRYASKERDVIAERFDEAKEMGREDPDIKIDGLPTGVEFKPFDKQQRQEDGQKKTMVRGYFVYNDFARNSVKPLFYRFLAGEPIFKLAKELGFGIKANVSGLAHARHSLRNQWYIGNKHRTKHISDIRWDDELNRDRHRGMKPHDNPIVVPTNLAKEPLIPKDVFDAVQDKLAVRRKEYDNRNKIIDEFLASPLLHCTKCGKRMYGRRGSTGRPDTYTCSTRYTKQSCDEPIYRRVELDREVVNRLFFLLNNPRQVEAKIDESLNDEHRAHAQAKLALKEKIVTKLEKEVKNLAVLARKADDSTLMLAEFNEATRELAAARNDVLVAQEDVSNVPTIDREALRRQIKQDSLAFRKKSMGEQKAILAKYVKSITAEKVDSTDPDTGDDYEPDRQGFYDYSVTLHVRMTFPTPLETGGKPIKSKGNKVAAHRTKSAPLCSARTTLTDS